MKHYPQYTITLKNGKKIKLWFIGKQLETILKDYDIPYVKTEGK